MALPATTAALAVVLGLSAAPPTARAVTSSIAAEGPMAQIAPGGAPRIYSLAHDGTVEVRSAATALWTRVANPPGVTSFYLVTGLAGVTPDASSGWYSRVFAVSSGASAALWELSDAGSWRSLGAPPGGSLADTPTIGAAYAYGSLFVGLRTHDRHVWTCLLPSNAGTCTWEDETCRGGGSCHYSSFISTTDVEWNPHTGDFDVLTIDMNGHVQRYDWNDDAWSTLPALPGGWWVDQTDIDAVYLSGDMRILVAGWNGGCCDRLYVARSINDGVTWTWTRLQATPSGDPPGGINYRMNSLHQTTTPGDFGTQIWAAFFTNGNQDQAWICPEPAIRGLGAICGGLGGANGNRPPELVATNDVVGPAVTGSVVHTSGLNTWYYGEFPGSFAAIRYLYELESSYQSGLTWQNLLAARDIVPLDDLGGMPEFSGAAHYGDVTILGCGYAKRSLDDGSTWTAGTNLFPNPGSRCDTSVSYDVDGNLYVTSPVNSTPVEIRVTRADSSSTWTAPATIPATTGNFSDRPWMTADKLRPNYLYLVWAASDGTGRITYCDGAGYCDDPARWCPRSGQFDPLPSGNGCGPGGQGCFIEQTGNGTLWLTIDRDTGCDPIPQGYNASMGVRRITNRESLGQNCAQPTFSDPECIYYSDRAFNTTQIHVLPDDPNNPPPPNGAGDWGRWGHRLATAWDSQRIAVTVQAYRDTSGGGPCTASSVHCRSDILTATRSVNGWCSPSAGCVFNNVYQSANMYLGNFDITPIENLPWVDHIYPATMVFDYSVIANSWFDFRGDPTDDKYYRVVESFHRITASEQVYESREYTPSTTTGTLARNVWMGDIDTVAGSPLHAFIARRISTGTGAANLGYLWAPHAAMAY